MSPTNDGAPAESVTVTVLVDQPADRATFAQIVAESEVSIPHDPKTGQLCYADARGSMNPRDMSKAERRARGISRRTPKREDRTRSYTAWGPRANLDAFLVELRDAGILLGVSWSKAWVSAAQGQTKKEGSHSQGRHG